MNDVDELHAHLAQGSTTTCRCWAVTRQDGVSLAFTDHDGPLSFEGYDFAANGGMTAGTLVQTTGLAIDNADALGALSDTRISEDDINAGRYDGAEVRSWIVNWTNVDQRKLLFLGSIGEIKRGDGAFEAELRGLTEVLNQPQGRSYLRTCPAVLGDSACRFDLAQSGFTFERSVSEVLNRGKFVIPKMSGVSGGWLDRGRFEVIDGAAAGLIGVIRRDRKSGGAHVVELWEPLRADVQPGDTVRLQAGCAKTDIECRRKFSNIENFQGFPHMPGDDWLAAVPRSTGRNNGGRLR